MNWYQKLNEYFPEEEMKSKEHMELLLKEKGDIYHKDEGPYHVLMYGETNDFVFVDYVYVSKTARGMGIGHELVERLKQKGKPVILEVEPVDYDDSDTEKRLHFYKREGFKHATSIGYRRRSLSTNEVNEMELLYWSPQDESEQSILEKMKRAYEEIHTYKDEELYGETYQDVEDVLMIEEGKNEDILEFETVKEPS